MLATVLSMADSVTDRSAVEATARDYVEGWYWGDAERMDRSLHEDLVKRLPDSSLPPGPDQLRSWSKARMVELTKEGGGGDRSAAIDILVFDCADDIATARVLSPDFLDYLHLVKTAEGWRIANIIFHPREQ